MRFAIFICLFLFFQAEDGIRDYKVTAVQTCALPICSEDGLSSFRLNEQVRRNRRDFRRTLPSNSPRRRSTLPARITGVGDRRLQPPADESHFQGERHLRGSGALEAQGAHRRAPGDEGLPVPDDHGRGTRPAWGTLMGKVATFYGCA